MTRPRFRRSSYVLRTLPSTLLCGFALAVAGCGDVAEPGSPEAELREAARATLLEPTTVLTIASQGTTSYELAGLIDLSDGRFELKPTSSEGIDPDAFLPDGVIGTDGEGYETTFAVSRDFGLSRNEDEVCWFNPHGPVGSLLGAISIEEATRLTGSIIESIDADEVRSAIRRDDGVLEVELARSASKPKDDFKPSAERTWGDRHLLDILDGPIEITVAEGRIESLHLALSDYSYEDYKLGRDERPPIDVTLDASFSPSDRRLEIDPPGCQAME